LDDDRLQGLHAEDARFSRIWKEMLKAEFAREPESLVNRLWDAGLELIGLHSRIEHWCRPSTTVIHAPQQIRHFRILIEVLGNAFDAGESGRRVGADWWQIAWDEVRRSRGEAIQTGVQEQQIIDEQLLLALRALDTEIRASLGQPMFQLSIPSHQNLRGVFRFYRVLAVEEGFLVPPGELAHRGEA